MKMVINENNVNQEQCKKQVEGMRKEISVLKDNMISYIANAETKIISSFTDSEQLDAYKIQKKAERNQAIIKLIKWAISGLLAEIPAVSLIAKLTLG